MTNMQQINRAAFVDLLGCSLARWNWDSRPEYFENLTQAEFLEIDLPEPIRNLLPKHPARSFGKDVWQDISKRALIALNGNKNKRSIMVSYRSCSTIAASIDVDTLRNWTDFARANFECWDLPLPKWPLKTYKDEWISAIAFFQKDTPEPFLSFEEARVLVHKLELVTVQDFRDYLASGMATERMPKRPDNYYKEEWQGWASFLLSKFVSYDEAVKMLEPYNLLSEADFRKLRADGKCPKGIPSHPSIYYADDWWSWRHFLSRDYTSKQSSI